MKKQTKTPFEQAQEQAERGELKTPSVMAGGKRLNYFGYQCAVHLFNLKIMASGMKCRGITFTDIKKYYGLKGRSAGDCVEQMKKIVEDYKAGLASPPAVVVALFIGARVVVGCDESGVFTINAGK